MLTLFLLNFLAWIGFLVFVRLKQPDWDAFEFSFISLVFLCLGSFLGALFLIYWAFYFLYWAVKGEKPAHFNDGDDY